MFPTYLTILVLSGQACSQGTKATDRAVGGPCDRCELMFEGMPMEISWKTTISTQAEPGIPMTIRGIVYQKDGKTPAADVIQYVYHTDNTGHYSPSPNQKEGTVHGHLRGWMKTDVLGRYQFSSIRPAGYPNLTAPQHIHVLIKEKHKSLYWIDEYLFDDDPRLNTEERMRQEKRGGSGVIHLTKNEKGEWEGRRDIILGLNIPNY